MKTNIVIVGNIYKKTGEIAEKLANDFDLYYANVEDIISYNLFSEEEEFKNKCGKTYLNKLKKGILKDIGNFENSLIFVDDGMFLEKESADYLKTYGTVVFINFSKEILNKMIVDAKEEEIKNALKVKEIAFDEKSSLCKEKSDVVVDICKDNFEKNYKEVKKVVEKYFL